jgi:outer membrane protein assembly factor BamB/predicted MPP superfamily phosphohydrolase
MKSLIPALFVLFFFPAVACLAASQSVKPFSFALITDTHAGDNGTIVAEDRAEVDAINNMTPSPEFVINCGDLLDKGTADQYVIYHNIFGKLRCPLYNCPGNHDVRWAPLGKESFQEGTHEPLSRSIDHNGCHFVLLDSTVILEHWGHFEAGELDWLKKDLKKKGRQTPVFLFFHHWIGRDSIQVDNENEFLDIIKPYNVKIVFCGHGHQNQTWRLNGVQYVMAAALYDGSFHYATVTPDTISLYRARKANNRQPELLAVVPIAPSPRAHLHAEIDCKQFTQVRARATPAAAQFSCRVDNAGSWTPFPAATATDPVKPAICPADFGGLTPGHHSLVVKASYPIAAEKKEEAHDGNEYGADNWLAVLPLEIPAAEPVVLWRHKLGGTVQSRLLFDNGTVYVSCFDGKVYALDSRTGRQKWAFATGGSVYATPEIAGRLLYVASTDHCVYALNPRSGKLVWKATLGGPVFAPVQVGAGVACVGAGDSKIYGLDASTGRQIWAFQAKGFIQSEAAYANDTFFVGAWDNTFYALNASDGSLKWSDHIGRSMFYSPGIARPIVYGKQVFAVSNDDTLHALDQLTGHEDWINHGAVANNKFGYSVPLVAADKIYIASLGDAGAVECLDAATGNKIWTSQTGSVIYDSSCAFGNGRLYVGAVSGDFHCLDAQTGKLIWTYHLPTGHLLATAAVDRDTSYISSMNGIVYALKTPGQSAVGSQSARTGTSGN